MGCLQEPPLASLATKINEKETKIDEPHTPWTRKDASKFDPNKLVLPVDSERNAQTTGQLLCRCKNLDDSAGNVITLIDQLGMRDNALLKFVTEQGMPALELDGKSFIPVLLGQRNQHKNYVFALQATRGITNRSDHYEIRSIRSENMNISSI